MAEPRVIKVSFSITGELEIRDFGDDYITFRNGDEMKRYDRKHAIKIIERNIERNGIEHYDVNIASKSRDMTEKDFPAIKEPVNSEPPF